jgi:surface protein
MKEQIYFLFLLFQICYLKDNYIIGVYQITQTTYKEKIINAYYQSDLYINDEKYTFEQNIRFQKADEYVIKFQFKKIISNMDNMFYGVNSLVAVDLSHFDSSDVKTMDNTFRSCKSLKVLDFTDFDASKVTYMGGLFKDSESIVSLDLSSFKTNSLTDMRNMFDNCRSLRRVDLSNFNTQKVSTMMYMFSNCRSLTSLDLLNFKLQRNIDLKYMFAGCKALKLLYFPSVSVTSNTYGMKKDCHATILNKK